MSEPKNRDPSSLEACVSKSAELVREQAKKGSQILVLSHYDTDGLASAGILGAALLRLDASTHIRAVEGLDEETLAQALTDTVDLVVLADLGSGMLELLNQKIRNKALVLDHHQPVGQPDRKILQVNPHEFGFDGAREVSSAGIAYLVARAIDAENLDLSVLGVVGALGDMQDRGEKRSLHGLNSTIVEDGVKSGCLKLDTDLLLFGRETRPIHKALAYTSNPFLPGLSGQEDKCLALLTSAGIAVKEDERWRTLADLADSEKQNLLSAIIRTVASKGAAGKVALNLIGTVYTLPKEERGIPTRDAREFSSLLNACGRMNRHGLAISICLGERGGPMDEGQTVLAEYRKTIAQYMTWVTESPDRVEELNAIYAVHGEEKIDPNMTGAISTILISSGTFDPMKAILVLARTREGELKMSARATEQLVISGVNLGKTLQDLTSKYGGSGGGHDVASGGKIPTNARKEFLSELDSEVERVIRQRS